MPPPAQTPAVAYVYAAADERPRGPVEEDLCSRASHTDFVYAGTLVLLDVATIALDNAYFQQQPGYRLFGPALIGVTWGATLGGGYLALPKCSPSFVSSSPPEGSTRASWPVALSLALLGGASAPILVGYETGTGAVTLPWSVTERSARLFVAGGAGFVGALLPYLLPPATWRAAKQLEHLRAGADARGGFVTYTVRF